MGMGGNGNVESHSRTSLVQFASGHTVPVASGAATIASSGDDGRGNVSSCTKCRLIHSRCGDVVA